MTTRHELLQREHMSHLADLDAVRAMDTPELAALERFMAFAAQHSLSDPNGADIEAYVAINDLAPDAAVALSRALHQVGLDQDFTEAVATAARNRASARDSKRLEGCHRRVYSRRVSTPINDWPPDWRATMEGLWQRQAYAKSILQRLQQRVGMLVWSAHEAGLRPDLNDPAVERALYDDLLARSEARECNNGVPRYAYLRSTAEELARFATAHGAPDATLARFHRSKAAWTKREQSQSPLKMAKVAGTPSAAEVLAMAKKGLSDARKIDHPTLRHQARLKWCAIGITVACAPRAEDVVTRLRWGDGVFFDARSQKYRIQYKTSKTGAMLKVPFEQDWSPFFDALLLGDLERQYLKAVRDKAISLKQPLFLKHDGEGVAYGWIGRMWESVVDTGSHIARMALYDELASEGELGLSYGRAVMGHSDQVIAKYRSDNARRASIRSAQDVLQRRAGAEDDDISDLI